MKIAIIGAGKWGPLRCSSLSVRPRGWSRPPQGDRVRRGSSRHRRRRCEGVLRRLTDAATGAGRLGGPRARARRRSPGCSRCAGVFNEWREAGPARDQAVLADADAAPSPAGRRAGEPGAGTCRCGSQRSCLGARTGIRVPSASMTRDPRPTCWPFAAIRRWTRSIGSSPPRATSWSGGPSCTTWCTRTLPTRFGCRSLSKWC